MPNPMIRRVDLDKDVVRGFLGDEIGCLRLGALKEFSGGNGPDQLERGYVAEDGELESLFRILLYRAARPEQILLVIRPR